ncbi:amidohydrolase family protein [Sphingopyxis sp. DHUNG17]|uniref:amidohydrolase family protein n=1 Tax=Sphingopyxis jiangsuensis TaxID=2871171 RepID=UPI00191EC41F|nr:amidohydrolase family protein [Sphingopyxis lutea]MBL0768507.1 amidohydrolase family protein [Sphingopyxis lutea]
MIIDAHHHLWKADRGDYHWMSPDLPVLARDYLVDDIAPLLRKAGVDRTILVQAAQTEAETDFLLQIAEETDFIAGVTGWLDLSADDFEARFAHYRRHPKFVAIRPMLQDIDDDAWILQPCVVRNLEHVAESGFPFEFLTYPRHLPHVVAVMRRVPALHAVIDHLSKPPIASGVIDPWAAAMAEVAAFPNLYCKLSGMVTEDDHGQWSPARLLPWIAETVRLFGPSRIMFGSDWPVCRLAAEYGEVIHALRCNLETLLEPADMERAFGSNAIEFYRLNLS